MTTVCCLLASCTITASYCDAQTRLGQEPGPHLSGSAFELATVDAETRWAFRTISPASVGSPIVRLRDVIKPLDRGIAGWQRLSRSPIGLVPVDGKVMVIERARLEKVIRQAEATPNAIDWIGPSRIEVVYRPGTPTATDPPSSVVHTSYHQPSDAHQVSEAAGNAQSAAPRVPITRTAARAIVAQLERSIRYQHPGVDEAFVVDIDLNQPELGPLEPMVGLPRIEFVDAVKAGECRLRVHGTARDRAITAVVLATLTPHPRVVFPKSTFQRGHRLRYEDLTLLPIPEEEIDGSYLSDPSELVGMEVRRTLRVNRPVPRMDVGRPILVRRGDLIEIRVIGGGVSVSTNGKSLEEGAESDTIEVETLDSRKRMLARVVHSGLVEIVTRAPRVSR